MNPYSRKGNQMSPWTKLAIVLGMLLAGFMAGRLNVAPLRGPARAADCVPTLQVAQPILPIVGGVKEILPIRTISKPLPARTICDNTCSTAGDGVCQDGRPGPKDNAKTFYNVARPVLCDLGTDCADCGPWVTDAKQSELDWKPVARLSSAGNKLLVKRVASPAGYLFGITDPNLDTDVSKKVDKTGLFEPILTMIWHDILADCIQKDGSRKLVVDVGANFGYYTLMAASLGCRVKAWEPVPSFAAFTQYGLLLNNLTHLVELSDKIVSDADGAILSMSVPKRGIWGTAGVGGANLQGDTATDAEEIKKTTERLDSVVHEDVLLIKADVEGFEPIVMKSARNLLLQHSVQNIIMEYSPGVGESAQNWKKSKENPEMIAALINAGYSAYDVPWSLEKEFPGFGRPVPRLERVFGSMLVHDIQDMERAQRLALGSTLHEALPEHTAYLAPVNTVPDYLHPHSYHSSFGYNTNIWLTRRTSVNGSSTATAAPLDFDLSKSWYLPANMATGRRPCDWMKDHQRLANRCRCPKGWSCAQAAKALELAVKKGALVPEEVAPVEITRYQVETW